MRAEATPYNPVYHEYLNKRIEERLAIEEKTKHPKWWLTWWNLTTPRNKGCK